MIIQPYIRPRHFALRVSKKTTERRQDGVSFTKISIGLHVFFSLSLIGLDSSSRGIHVFLIGCFQFSFPDLPRFVKSITYLFL